MDHLILTLGHNSSAILVRDNKIVAGYETERLTGVKSDSSFPLKPIDRLLDLGMSNTNLTIHVGHWELSGDYRAMQRKHWDADTIRQAFPKAEIYGVNDYFTHHDSHAWSAALFAGDGFPGKPEDRTYLIVCDGFGTFGEHLSVYRYVDGIPVLLERKFGFGTSMGLLYQYTTLFLGMKMNQDEYKLLAYEAHIDEVKTVNRRSLSQLIEDTSDVYLSRMSHFMTADKTDPMLNVGALPTIASDIGSMLSGVLSACFPVGSSLSERDRRVVIAYFTQSVVERVLETIVNRYTPKNLILVGGVFYNVKLNNLLASSVDGKTCIMPLAGDQGAGLGLYKAMYPDFQWPGHVFWGIRDLRQDQFFGANNLMFTSNESIAFDAVNEELDSIGMVNVVRGAMEFGPRALCHTSTLAVPDDTGVAAYVNHINDRTNEMPFAPVMTPAQANELLVSCDKIHESLGYMVCTRRLKDDPAVRDLLRGASHRDPNFSSYTARPQVVTGDRPMVDLLYARGPLINTSFNYHGVPIVWNAEQVRHTHYMEQMRARDDRRPVTIVIGDQ